MNYLVILILALISNYVVCQECRDCSDIWGTTFPQVSEVAEIGKINETQCLGNIQRKFVLEKILIC